ncbi:MAG: 30S ribosomal protein S6, partial [Epsilonproteobacteria bacterium]|nr:30S ribosomal protein S6 [Campylobacterota bacterium]
KFERGHYYIIYFIAPSQTVRELERIYRITEDVIRFLTIKYETKKDIAAWEKMVERAKKAGGTSGETEKAEAEA